ncbi:MAG: 1,6-anhydro-N-acetylmuramyl-L-alanine amidase AmpD [gamma proteobacterium symbiont of Bathyaustriella thionipta]|nr:1,6-anhydro-N-acetylmuramyl-L-alanine amidase AmpD [gamma proteobacterium symbiont of Bathyaustriella thionipta]MCU7948642.1 1,6-anhydro-N-acetylmuramyl-L-alanine amidase AmpD [gamma proteobacterium symbiont of Bathyaustriella thionipta]MCU7953048.1 1,6-anhydro-N-acetylmuramyl-L-alanine amidase AmpD [gamma proteobacterium symbiont of Bathyaustriella thionipta]MCU7955352.1 1,6-anhydro-N-acetylmuramyl-L-alanine amidase AmpD [gamma proteobacterium symbiont of Bathyaustriella thionipta]MCU796785
MYDISDGWFKKSRKIISPNYNERPEDSVIDAIIIHSISLPPGCYQGNDIHHFFSNQLDCDKDPFYDEIRDVMVSAHLLIRRSGELVQYVSLFDRAWHAGQSRLGEQENCNDFSIGIELEGTDNSLFESAQYHTLTNVVSALLDYFPQITRKRIVGHSDIAPGRKTDPGSGFDWGYWQAMLTNSINSEN